MFPDINTVRTLITVLAFTAFLGVLWWAYAPSRRERFERDGQLVFDDPGDDPGDGPGDAGGAGGGESR